MPARLASVLAVIALAAPAGAQITASLKPAANQDPADRPYRSADLTIDNRGKFLITGVRLRNAAGGPIMVFDVTVPPASVETLRVRLPATSLQQSWLVTFIDKRGPDDSVAAVPITWPVELVTEQAFIAADTYRSFNDTLASWPAAWKGHILLASVLGVLALAATLLIRKPVLRLAAAALVVALAAGGAALAVTRIPTVVELTISDGDGVLHVLSARRTVEWHSERTGMYPLYRSRRHMESDDAVIHARGGVWMTLSPHEVRCLREPPRDHE